MSGFGMEKERKKFWERHTDCSGLILQSLSEGVCVIDADFRIAFTNNSCAHMLGFEADQIIGKTYEKIFFRRTDFDAESEVCPIRFTLLEGANSHIKTETFYRKNNTDFLVEYVCAPIFEKGKILGAVLTFEDITERREIETAISKARDAAYEAARTKAAFLANMSHEIRTPLSGIIGTTNLLAESNLSAEQASLVKMLQKSAGWLMETVNDILDYSKIEAGKLALDEVDFNLSQTITEIIELYKVSAVGKNLCQVFEIDKNLPEVLRGDVMRLRQVLGNLLANAIKFTKEGSVVLRIFLVRQTENNCVVRFEVADTGIGISDVQKAKLFQPFVQADASTTREFGGTGLGLTICRELVELMHGEIGVESIIERGSTFWFEIPLVESSRILTKINENANISLKNGQGEFPESYSMLKVLVAEDNEVNRLVANKMLEQFEIDADFALSGAEAVKMCGENIYDLILMDCQMPGTDGFSATEIIRRDLPDNPVIIALTANTSSEEKDKCIRAGMNDFLSKPLMKGNLEAVLKKYFSPPVQMQN